MPWFKFLEKLWFFRGQVRPFSEAVFVVIDTDTGKIFLPKEIKQERDENGAYTIFLEVVER